MTANNKFGVNILGFFKYQFGIAELARLILASLEQAHIPYLINNLEALNHNIDKDLIQNISNDNIYPINIIVANASETGLVLQQKTEKYLKGKYNIGVWCWETEQFPLIEHNTVKYFNEIWTISEFCKESIKKTVNLPISVIRLPVILPNNLPYFSSSRIPKNKFAVLFTFDFLSIFERKNPLAVVEVFKKAFGNDMNALLIIKSINKKYNSQKFQIILQAIKNFNNIIIFDESLNRIDTLSLINSCDVYISLHRSEGLGLSMKEAMAMGKVVIATNYSGNLDFMSNDNSLLVQYNKVQIPITIKCYYKKEIRWAEPDINDAVNKLKQIYTDKILRETISKNAKKYIEEEYNIDKCGNEFLQKITNIYNYIN